MGGIFLAQSLLHLALGAMILFAPPATTAQAARDAPLQPSTCALNLPEGAKTTIIFVADPGKMSKTPEAQVYLENLKNRRTIGQGQFACASVDVGTIMGQSAAVITTGIGPTSAALCVFDVVVSCGPGIKEVLYSGTSGWSSQLGGVINNGTCESGLANTNGRITRIGDVCVSPYAVVWECRKASFSETCKANLNQCNFPPQEEGPAQEALFGQCTATHVPPQALQLTAEVLAVAAKKGPALLPRRSGTIQGQEELYWSRMQQGTGLSYPALEPSAAPRVWSHHQCMEVDSQYFWSGAPWELVARKYAADALNTALEVSSFHQEDVIAVGAMEGIGLGMAMERYHARSSTRRIIPYTNVRGMSNVVHQPLAYQGAGFWAETEPVPEDIAAGYKYAISTASTVVLSLLQSRCEDQQHQASSLQLLPGPAPLSSSCSFHLTTHHHQQAT